MAAHVFDTAAQAEAVAGVFRFVHRHDKQKAIAFAQPFKRGGFVVRYVKTGGASCGNLHSMDSATVAKYPPIEVR